MPIEVIELPSSPESCMPPPRGTSNPNSTKNSQKKLSNHESHGSNAQLNEEEWFVLSDNEDRSSRKQQRSLAKPQENSWASKAGPKAAKKRNLEPVSLGEYGKGLDPFDFEDSFGQRVSSPPLRRGVSNGISVFGGGSAAPKANDGFFFPSDNFEDSINLDDPFGIISKPPQAKKRRLLQEYGSKPPANGILQEEKRLERVLSDTGHKSRTGGRALKPGEFNRSKKRFVESDPIDLSSEDEYSRMARERRNKARKARDLEWGSDGDNSDDIMRSVQPKRKRTPKRTPGADISSDLDMPDVRIVASSVSASNRSSILQMDATQALAKYNAEKAAEHKLREKAMAAQQKALTKEAEKERKLLAKEEKAREKENAAALARVNTMRIDKKVSTPEMILDYPIDLVDSKLADQICSFLNPLSVECQPWLSTIPNVFKWRRKAEAIYNEEQRRWEPTKMYVKEENHVMCYMLAAEFVDLAAGVEGHDLTTHVLKMKSRFDGCTIIYLIEGLAIWMRKNKNIRNRQFTEAVRSQMYQDYDDNATSSQRQKKTKKQQEYMDADMIEDQLLRLQVIHGALIHHTAAVIETAQWVVTFTQHISTIPGRLEKMSLDTGFCMESGQVKTGENPADTFVKMLQEVTRITLPIAYGIAAEYPSAKKLIEGFEEGGKDILTSLKKSSNKDGALTDREIGRRISRRVWSIFMSRDETITDI